MNKRVLCIILCMTMCISTILPCFADDGSKTDFTVAEKIADYLFNLPKEDMKSFLSDPRVYVKTDDQLKSLLNELTTEEQNSFYLAFETPIDSDMIVLDPNNRNEGKSASENIGLPAAATDDILKIVIAMETWLYTQYKVTIYFARHAAERMIGYGLSTSQVQRAIRYGTRCYDIVEDSYIIWDKAQDIAVVVSKARDAIVTIIKGISASKVFRWIPQNWNF